MSLCPFCDHENFEGVDVCAQCEQPLTEEHLHDPETAVERGLLSDHLDLLESRPPVAVAPDAATSEVMKLMIEKQIGCVLVVEDNQLKGIFSERDVLMKLNTEAAELADRPVSQFMTSKVDTLDNHAKIAFAVQRMDLGSFRHVPILDASLTPVGIVSVRDILRYITKKSAQAS